MSARWVKTGLAGYGPDLDAEDETYDSMPELCSGIQYELSQAADSLEERAHASAESEDYEDAWKSHALAVELDTLSLNLDWEHRSAAPIYRNGSPDYAALTETMERIIADTFPLDITPDGCTRLYVWEAR